MDNRIVKNIRILLSYRPDLIENLVLGYNQELEININDLFEIIPMTEKKTKCYNGLIKYLRSLGINMNIVTNSNFKSLKSHVSSISKTTA